MENKRQIVLIAIAVLAGIAAAFLIANWKTQEINQKTQELHDQYDQQQKQMASEMEKRSEQQVGALRQELNQVVQQQQQAIQQAVAAAKASQDSQGASKSKKSAALLTAKTPQGKRAVTVMVESLNAVGGLINAGDYVDVIAHLEVPEYTGATKKKTLTAMIFQDLQVLAINTNLDQPGDYTAQQSSPTLRITFAVDPQEAGLLVFANKNGKLELALRASDENDKQMVKTSTWRTLADYVLQNQGSAEELPGGEVVKEQTENTKPYIQIFRGGKEL
jgi:Flp pilus assembly protein CpaB